MPVVLSVFESGQFLAEKAGGEQGTEPYEAYVRVLGVRGRGEEAYEAVRPGRGRAGEALLAQAGGRAAAGRTLYSLHSPKLALRGVTSDLVTDMCMYYHGIIGVSPHDYGRAMVGYIRPTHTVSVTYKLGVTAAG